MDRYRDIIDDWDAFQACIQTPQPKDIRVNTLKSTKKQVMDALDDSDIPYTELDWNNTFLRLETDKPGNTRAHWLGWYYVQESVSGIPPTVLDPDPTDHVLDMCAAPGSKTTQLAALMDNRGAVTANEVNGNRVQSLAANMYRTGCLNVSVTEKDGRQIPEDRAFDRILVDAPCSAEGNLRDKPYLRDGASMDDIENLATLQTQLLSKAVKLCKAGGTIVYSTCTFAPEEDELVVQQVLDEHDDLELEPVSLPFDHADGLTEWQGQTLDKRLERCARVYPHHLDSGGMFIAKLTTR